VASDDQKDVFESAMGGLGNVAIGYYCEFISHIM
jgi:hypothetical protein